MQHRGLQLPQTTSYCNCCGKDDCCNPHTRRQSAQAGDEEDVEEGDVAQPIEMVDFDFEETEMDDEEDFVEEILRM